MAWLTHHGEVVPYVTRDGSTIRELMHPKFHGNRAQSLAEAEVTAGASTILHRHQRTEELYHVLSGRAVMTLGDRRFPIGPGDTVAISPGTPHALHNPGPDPLRILCCCAPAYDHADTELLVEPTS